MHTADGFTGLLQAFRLALTVEGLRPSTIEYYVRDAQGFVAFVGDRSPRSITPADIREYFASYQDGRSPKTVREAQLALRRFFR